MRALVVTSSYPRYAGDYYGSFVEGLCQKLTKHGVEVTVLSPRSRSTSNLDDGIRVRRFPYMPRQRLETLTEGTLKYAPPGSLIQLPPYLCSAYINMLGEQADLVHAHFAIPMGLIAAMSLREAPLLITCHGSDCTLPFEKPILGPFVKRALKRADRVVAVSEFVKGLALRLGAIESKLSVIYTGIDTRKFTTAQNKDELRRAMGVPTDKLVISTLGRLVQEKRVEDLIMAAAALRDKLDAYILIGGEGSERSRLERFSRQLKLDNIRFLGEIRDARMFHQMCDIFVLTSVREGLSVSLQEAMASGSVPVAVDGYGCPEVIEDGENGFLFRPGDARDLAGKILEAAINLDLGEKARSTIVRRFDVNKNVVKYVELYGELASR